MQLKTIIESVFNNVEDYGNMLLFFDGNTQKGRIETCGDIYLIYDANGSQIGRIETSYNDWLTFGPDGATDLISLLRSLK